MDSFKFEDASFKENKLVLIATRNLQLVTYESPPPGGQFQALSYKFQGEQVFYCNCFFFFLATGNLQLVTYESPPPGLNRRPRPYQGRALPTELDGQFVWVQTS